MAHIPILIPAFETKNKFKTMFTKKKMTVLTNAFNLIC